MDDYFKIVAAGRAMVVTIGLWLVLAPAIGAIARTGKSGKKEI